LIAGIRFEGFTTSPAFARVCHARSSGCLRAPDVRKHREEEPKGRSKKSFQEKIRKKTPAKKNGISSRRFSGNIIPPLTKGARQALDALKSSSRIRFELIPDDLGAAHLPAFVKTPQAVTDGHLVELARKNSLCLVTLDRGIPGALIIG